MEADQEQVENNEEPRHSIATWLRVDRDVVEGLHILRMSADPSWIVRKDLYIKLESLVHAQTLFSVDLDLGKIRAGLPDVLSAEAKVAEAGGHERPVWLPILRQPSTRAFSQRVSSAIDGNNQAVPIMRGSDVRYRLSAALAWLFLSGCFQARGRKPRLGEIARLQVLVQVALDDYLASGSEEALEQALANDPTAPNELHNKAGESSAKKRDPKPLARQAIDQLKELATDPVPRRRSGVSRDTTYEGAFRHCLTYARTGRFVVVGLTPGNSRHVECHLLPTELSVSTTEAPRRPTTALGFDLTEGRHIDFSSKSALKRFGQRCRELTRPWHRPAAYHFQFPVPEVSLLDGSHVTIETDEDVAISPAVLFHDHTVDDRSESRTWQAQAYGDDHWSASLSEELKEHRHEENMEALSTVALPDLRHTERALEARLGRLEAAREVLRTTSSDRRERQDGWGQEADLPTIAATRATHKLANELVSTIEPTASENPNETEPDAAARRLKELADNLGQNPHLELTPDDDPREHVAHFHTPEARSITPRDRDRRPVIHGVLRASQTGATGYARMATLTCKVNASLLVAVTCLVSAAVIFDREYSVDALVTVLLLVPGISATLLGRMPADTIRYVVLQRWSSLVLWSLLWPAVTALLLATFLIGVERIGWLWLLLVPSLVGGPVTALRAHIESRRARYGFNVDTNLTGRIVPDHRRDLTDAGPETRSVSSSYYRANVDTRVVLDVCSAGLFQADRPSRRFMVWVGLHDDQPGDFDQVVKTLEAATDTKAETAGDGQGSASGDASSSVAVRTGLTIESSTCQAAAGSGAVMAIISGERHQWRPDRGPADKALEHDIAAELETNPNFDSDANRKVDVVVHEIDAAPNYFFYSAPRFIDTVFSVPPDKRNTLPWLIKRIWEADTRKYRVSYLHSPSGNATSRTSSDSGERAVLKLGLAFDRGYEPVVTSSLLQLHRFASQIDGCRMEAFDRRAYPEPAAEQGYPPSEGYRSVAISSAGPGDTEMMRALMNRLYPVGPDCDPNADHRFSAGAPFRFAGASIMTAGGYASRVLRFEAREGLQPTIPAEAMSVGDERVRTWQVNNVDMPEPDRHPMTFPVWLRWQLHGENLAELLAAARRLEHSTVDETLETDENDLPSVELNLEFLNNRVTDLGQMNGKARYRARLWFPNGTSNGAEGLDDPGRAFRQALHASLQRELGPRLTGNSTYMLVSDEEPRRPASSDERDSEFNSY